MSNFRTSTKTGRYSRNTQGWNAQGFFSPESNKALATEATIDAMVYAPASKAGTIGVYAGDGNLHDANVLVLGQTATIVQKNSAGDLKRSTELVVGDFTVTKTAYSAAVTQIDTLASLGINIVGGLQEFVLSVRETTPGNQPFPTMEGRAIVRGGAPTDYAIATAIAQDISNTYDFERNSDNAFATVDVISDIAGTAAAAGTITVTKGSNTVVLTGAQANLIVGNYVGIVAAAGPTVTTPSWFLITGKPSATQLTLDRAWSYDSEIIAVAANSKYANEAAVVAGATGMRVVGVDELVHFDTAVSEDLADAVITHTADWNMGAGAGFQVASMEDECVVFDGQTTGNAAFKADYGEADLYVNDSLATTTYSLYFIESLNRIIPSAAAPVNQTLMKANVVIAAVTGSSLETRLDLLFGT